MSQYLLYGPLKNSKFASEDVLFENDLLLYLKKRNRQLNSFGLQLDIPLEPGIYEYQIPMATSISIEKNPNKNGKKEENLFIHLMFNLINKSKTISRPRDSNQLDLGSLKESWLNIHDSHYEIIQNSLGVFFLGIISLLVAWVNRKLNNSKKDNGSARTNPVPRSQPEGHGYPKLEPV